MTDWKNRIVKYGEMAADQFLANPANPRRHPVEQREAVKGSLDTLGWIAPVIVNANTKYLVDGHERVMQALAQGDSTPVPYIEVNLSEAEEALALASFDWITQMASYDRETLTDLMHSVDTDNAALQTMLDEMAKEQGVVLPDGNEWESGFDKLPTEDRALFQQMTFTLHDSQIETVKQAMSSANKKGVYDTLNENGNGNALTRICEAYLDGQG